MTTSEELMSQPVQQMIVPIQNEAHQMHMQYGHMFEPPAPGIYLVGEVKPLIELNKSYFELFVDHDRQVQRKLVEDINSVNGGLYDANGTCVVKAEIMREKEKWLRNEPTVPVRAYMIIMGLVKHYFDSIAPYRKHNAYSNKILVHIKPEFHDLYNSGVLDNLMVSIFQRLSDFIGRDTWHIYFEDFLGLDIVIKKMCDFRVHDWHQKMESGQWKMF